MALANIAVLLGKLKRKVLMVDWDIEAPGLDKYINKYREPSKSSDGLIDLLLNAKNQNPSSINKYIYRVSNIKNCDNLYFLPSGLSSTNFEEYTKKLTSFNWEDFFGKHGGGEFIEKLREDWLKEYDFVLIDSRTGITDSGGVCTIQLPDIIIPVFTANEQSLFGIKHVINSIQKSRQRLAYDRGNLLVFPLLSRHEGNVEFEKSKEWLTKSSEVLREFYDDWIPTKKLTPYNILEKTKLPYIPYFSFGEELAVEVAGTNDPASLGYAYLTSANLINQDFKNIDHIISNNEQKNSATTSKSTLSPKDENKLNLHDITTRQALLTEKLTRLQQQRDLEHRVEEQMRSEKLIADTQEALYLVEQKLLTHQQNNLISKANTLKRNGEYKQALNCWHQIQLANPDSSSAAQEIALLETLQANQTKAVEIIKRLAFRMKDIKPIFKGLATTLRQPDSSPNYSVILEQTEAFLDGKLDAGDFIYWYATENPITDRHGVNIEALARRIQRGEVVLFLGSDVVSTYGDKQHGEHPLVRQLAAQIGYEHFDGSLSSIAEYYQLRPDLGVTTLLDNLRQSLPDAARVINLYQALSKTNMPLILISSGYDNLLESTFQATGKHFVELASIINRSEDYDIGHVVVSYSDHSKPTYVCPEEELSRLRLLESGYSIIYKIRGTCETNKNQDSNFLGRDAMILSESDYFSFARYADRIIPDYLARQFRNRGFLFIGYRPKEWEDRLLVSALLEKRRNAQEPCYVIGNAPQAGEQPKLLESAFWEHRNVRQYHVDFHELDAYFGEAEV
ncbi:CobQ/CobB/MinD/ParA nucleotide binding domain-containing protein [Thiothrix caldifontis]|uniref:CobQ/CobB/MinD/ParA nucleotide binding domain-containing protein n=2 Tax=Thiothrix caldifontis TaxID=525918 RepID=A0A1H3VNC4_9GAMM|nr:CobQ/CobB/MinD/ParA nucleotide binding domain-containing protein [Thiothrix caldifontis]